MEKPEGIAWARGPIYFPIIQNFNEGHGPPKGLTADQLAQHLKILEEFDSKPF
jgi:hypothetical protein